MDNKNPKTFRIPHPSPDVVQAADGTKRFTGVYTIDVNAKDFDDAAVQIEDLMRNGDYRPCLHILSPDDVQFIDLESLEVQE